MTTTGTAHSARARRHVVPSRGRARLRGAASASRRFRAVRSAGPDPRAGRGFGPLPHRHPRGPRRLAGQALAAVRPRARGRGDRRGARPRRVEVALSATASRFRGSVTRAGPATTASPAGRRSASSRRTWATRSTAVRGVRDRVRAVRRQGSRRSRPVRRGAAHVRGVTTYKAIKVAGTDSSDLVAVFGVGGLGHLAIQYAIIAGGRASSPSTSSTRSSSSPGRSARRVHGQRSRGGPGRGHPGRWAAPTRRSRSPCRPRRSSRRTARCAGAARSSSSLPAENHIELPIFETVLNGITVVGSIVGTRADLREVFELHAAGKTEVP